MEDEDRKETGDHVWWPLWRWDWYQWVFIVIVGFWLNLTGLLCFTDFVNWLGSFE